MTQLLAPTVLGPVSESCTSAALEGQRPDARVVIHAGTRAVAHAVGSRARKTFP